MSTNNKANGTKRKDADETLPQISQEQARIYKHAAEKFAGVTFDFFYEKTLPQRVHSTFSIYQAEMDFLCNPEENEPEFAVEVAKGLFNETWQIIQFLVETNEIHQKLVRQHLPNIY